MLKVIKDLDFLGANNSLHLLIICLLFFHVVPNKILLTIYQHEIGKEEIS